MTEVSFHFNVPDKIGYACRLLRKAYATGNAVGVLAAPEALQALDASLWTFSASDFIPHCAADAPPAMLAASPIVLAADSNLLERAQVLLHLGTVVPAGFERFERLIELVGSDAPDREAARTRWRHYADRGYTIHTHDAAPRRDRHD